MFGDKKSLKDSERSLISETVSIDGTVNSSGAIDVAGLVKGPVYSKEIVIKETGSISGGVEAETVEIHGHLDGKVSADNVVIGSSGVVKGDIEFSQNLRTENGADIEGYIKKTASKSKITGDFLFSKSKDEKKAKRIAAGTVAFYASVKTYDEFFTNHGFGTEAAKIRQLFKNSDIKGMIDSVPDEMVDVFAIAGNKDFVSESINRYTGIVDEIKLTPPTHYVTENDTRYAQKSILSLVKEGEVN